MDDLKQCYAILELEDGASLDAVERAHRELSRVWHPDRFASDSPELQERAQGKQQEINSAYEHLVARLAAPAAAPTDVVVRPAAAPAPSEPGSVVPSPPASPLRRLGEMLTDYVAPVLRDVVLPAVARRLSDRVSGPGKAGSGQGERPVRRRARDGSGGGGGRRGGGQGPGGGLGRANGSGRGRGGRRGK